MLDSKINSEQSHHNNGHVVITSYNVIKDTMGIYVHFLEKYI